MTICKNDNKKLKRALEMALTQLTQHRLSCEKDKYDALADDLREAELAVCQGLYILNTPNNTDIEAETYRDMYEIATKTLGYPSILEALEAAPHADDADTEENLVKRDMNNAPRVVRGLDNQLYLAFLDSVDCENFLTNLGHPNPSNVRFHCVGNYENALLINI